MGSPEFITNPPNGFSILSIIRGFQLTIVGAYRALQNPDLFRGKYYRQAAYAITISILIQLLISVPLWIVHVGFKILSWIFAFSSTASFAREPGNRARAVVNTLSFLESHVINLSGLLVGLIRYFRPEMDNMFMESLRFIDSVYFQMHPDKLATTTATTTITTTTTTATNFSATINQTSKPPQRFYDPLSLYSTSSGRTLAAASSSSSVPAPSNAAKFVSRYLRRAILSTAIYTVSQVPILGSAVIPIFWFASFRRNVGVMPAVAVFATSFYLPTRVLTSFWAAYWGSRSLTRELLIPYFARMPFSIDQRNKWYRAREGVLFGFGFGFYFLLKLPYVGVLMYGMAEASAAFLITKITDPPPMPSKVLQWTESQTSWNKRDEMLCGKIVEFEQPLPGSWSSSSLNDSNQDNKIK
ncbi:hypothetical protein V1514DRAFT_277487 [Lipomyces japonicus]|uniref:uncharacterized protein n=1 Tax=Lipomyces japonicus TaxID=56871 RepID=UPI0034CD80DB